MKAWICIVAYLLISCLMLEAQQVKQHNQLPELKSAFMKLRNTDPQIEKVSEWEDLAGRFEQFVKQFPKHSEAPSALLNASVLYERLYRRLGEKSLLASCTSNLATIARDYPGHRLADDALVRLGDIQSGDLGDKQAARLSFQEVVDAYADSDMYDLARTRLDQLEGKLPQAKQKHEKQNPEQQAQLRTAGKPVIVIDPGHGGEDYGAVGVGGLLEKDVTLAVALQLEKLLSSELNAVVRLTRRKDAFIPLAERTSLANDFEADLFISLHANASPGGKLAGLETYYLDNSGDKASQLLADRENRSTRFEGPDGDLAYMLSDLIQNAKLADSIKLAKSVNDSVYSSISDRWVMGRNFGVKKAPFYVLVGAHMPCILIELGFIDHQVDGANLADGQFRSELARGLLIGIKNYLSGAS